MADNTKGMMTVDIKDNSKAVMAELEKKIKRALFACGNDAVNYATDDCPVDTGRLRNSITYATADTQSSANTFSDQAADTDEYKVKEQPEKNAVYIGTNVKYAPDVEYLSRKHKSGKAHFLRDAVANHRDVYKADIETALKS